jgi:RHS repeat-associated protein
MGRLFATTLPDNTSVTNVFNSQGLLGLTYGSRVYPVGYGYDAQGRMKYMTNWSDFNGHSGARITTWSYDPYRGFLTGKSYDNGNSAGPAYSYTAAGRLQARMWARGITTSYSYGPAGDLSGVGYSDGTASISYGYDRRGRQTSITNGLSVCALTLNDAGNALVEAYSGTGPLTGISVTNGYDSFLRRTRNTTLNNGALLTLVNEAYDAASRPVAFSDGINTASYGYIANSPLVGEISFSNYNTLRMVTTRSYDNLNRLMAIGTTNTQGVFLDSHTYAYNIANQRTAVTNVDSSYWVYQYDNLGQVTSGVKYWSDGTPVAGQQFGYGFDSIGNRQSTVAGGDQTGANLRSASYAANNLNQYTNRTVPGALDIMGTATNVATVTVNGQPTYRHNDYYRAQLATDNSAGPVFQSVSNLAVLTVDTNVISTNIIGNVFLPQTPEALTYDADGNLTSDGRWTYLWDGENRLIGMTNNANVPDAVKMTLSFSYDYLGRRIGKTVSKYNSATSSYQVSLQNTFVYDGWNLQAELNATNNAVVRSYVWGLDLSGTRQGAGGVGGLLWTFQPQAGNARAFLCYDGNGNVSTLVYSADASIVGQYEYGPFGELLRATRPMANANPFRFSTKYEDNETDLLYYGYRYYNAITGRWLNRDLINENGGLNVFGFVNNRPFQDSDALGLNGDGNPIMGLGGAWNNDPYGQAGPFYGPGVSAWNQNGSAWGYGLQWAMGTAPNLTLGPNNSWTVDMQRSYVMNIDRSRMRDALEEYCSRVLPPPLHISLGNELGDIPPWLYPMVFASDLIYNPTAAFVGSWTGGDMTATEIDCCGHRARVHIHAFNISGTISLSHSAPKNRHYGAHFLPDNILGYDGPMHSVTQTFDWDEYIFF